MKKLTLVSLVLVLVLAVGAIAMAAPIFPQQNGAPIAQLIAAQNAANAEAEKIAAAGRAERARLVEENIALGAAKASGDIGGVFAMALARTFNPANFDEAMFKMYGVWAGTGNSIDWSTT